MIDTNKYEGHTPGPWTVAWNVMKDSVLFFHPESKIPLAAYTIRDEVSEGVEVNVCNSCDHIIDEVYHDESSAYCRECGNRMHTSDYASYCCPWLDTNDFETESCVRCYNKKSFSKYGKAGMERMANHGIELTGQEIADANLMAAAPDLLAEVERLRDLHILACDYLQSISNGTLPDSEWPHIHAMIRGDD